MPKFPLILAENANLNFNKNLSKDYFSRPWTLKKIVFSRRLSVLSFV